MCGIVGIWCNNHKYTESDIRKMAGAMSHRGPDYEGVWSDDYVNFGHRRLSIIDLSVNGHQPMHDISDQYVIVFNGEIYNYPELKASLIGRGCQFKTSSDTEVILSLYKEYGEKTPSMLNGIFSFVIWDKKNKELFAARDFYGVKPFYFYRTQSSFVFASEIRAILAFPHYEKELDVNALNAFLTFRFNPSPYSLFKNINKLSAGQCIKISAEGDFLLYNYDVSKPAINENISFSDAVAQYQYLLEKAVERQLLADVPVSLFLSGGIDSAVMGVLMQKYANYKIKTFTVGFEGSGDYNELDHARETAAHIGSDHSDYLISKAEYFESFFQSCFALEEPIGHNSIPAFHIVSKQASKEHKVAICGQGADEVLAGYNRYIAEKYISKNRLLAGLVPWGLLESYKPFNESIRRLKYSSGFSNELDRFVAIYSIFTHTQRNKLLKPELQKSLDISNASLISDLYSRTENYKNDSLNRILFIDTRSLADNLLLIGDKISMSTSLELRVPFLDVELVNFLESLPGNFKLKGLTNKYIHKQALSKWLPEHIINRKKLGFETPFDNWLHGTMGKQIRNTLTAGGSACAQFFNIKELNNMFDLHIARKYNYQRHIFMLYSFEIWYNYFFRNQSIATDFRED